MQSSLPPHFYSPSEWDKNLTVPTKSIATWKEMKTATSKQPLILRKSSNTKRTMLYPVKKAVLRQQDSDEGPPPKRACAMGQEVAANIRYEPSMSSNFRMSCFSSRPLKLIRPGGNVFNLQAPGGGRAATPLLHESCEPSESAFYPSEEASTYCTNQQISHHGNRFVDIACEEKPEVNAQYCRPEDDRRQTMNGAHFASNSQQPSTSHGSEFFEPFQLNAAELRSKNFHPSRTDCGSSLSTVQNSEGPTGFRPQYVSVDEKFVPQEQHHFTDTYRNTGPESVFANNGADVNALLTPPLSLTDQLSPTEKYLCGISDYEPQAGMEQYPYPAHNTPPGECFFPQAKDIDYTIFDEFFVRM